MSQSLGHISQQTLINAIIRAAVQQKARLALWQPPQKKTWKLLICLKTRREPLTLQAILRGKKGFVLNPFAGGKGLGKPLFLTADAILEKEGEDLVLSWQKTADDPDKAAFQSALQQALEYSGDPHYSSTPKDYSLQELLAKPQFIELVNKALAGIKAKEFSKIVVARASYRNVPKIINFAQLFDRLCSLYPEAFVSLVYLGEHGFWVGASPEPLLAREKDHHCKTVALAGTIAREGYKAGTSISSWSEKELHEHRLVSHYIKEVLQERGIKKYQASSTRSHAIAHLFHLRKDFSFTQNDPENSGCDLADLIYGLHPTPAVCGLPKTKAMDFIAASESFERFLYAGFLGPVNLDGGINLFVNIRCMNIKKERAILYAGAGITEGSIPEKEWQETGLKMRMMATMLDDDVPYLAVEK